MAISETDIKLLWGRAAGICSNPACRDGGVNIFYIGGGWCGYTQEAKEFCQSQNIGLFVTDEMHGALWKADYWTYHRRDKDGNPVYYYKVA